jgi:hypothetical protein
MRGAGSSGAVGGWWGGGFKNTVYYLITAVVAILPSDYLKRCTQKERIKNAKVAS